MEVDNVLIEIDASEPPIMDGSSKYFVEAIKKAGRDLANGRGDWKTNVSKILYYGFVQNLIFTTMQNALFGMIWDDEEDDEMYGKKKIRAVNSMTDTLLRGSGVYGAIASTLLFLFYKF